MKIKRGTERTQREANSRTSYRFDVEIGRVLIFLFFNVRGRSIVRAERRENENCVESREYFVLLLSCLNFLSEGFRERANKFSFNGYGIPSLKKCESRFD